MFFGINNIMAKSGSGNANAPSKEDYFSGRDYKRVIEKIARDTISKFPGLIYDHRETIITGDGQSYEKIIESFLFLKPVEIPRKSFLTGKIKKDKRTEKIKTKLVEERLFEILYLEILRQDSFHGRDIESLIYLGSPSVIPLKKKLSEYDEKIKKYLEVEIAEKIPNFDIEAI